MTRDLCERQIIGADDREEYLNYLETLDSQEVNDGIGPFSTLAWYQGKAVLINSYAADVCNVRYCGAEGLAISSTPFVVPTEELTAY